MMDMMSEMMSWFLGRNNSWSYSPGLPFSNPYGFNGLPYGLNTYPNAYSPYFSDPSSIQDLNHVWSGSRAYKTAQPDDELPFGSFWGDSSGWGTSNEPWDGGHYPNIAGYVGFDGVWLAATGERWFIQGSQFVLYHANGGVSKGEYRVDGEWIHVHNYNNQMTVTFQFRQMENLLIIRDKHGQLVILKQIQQGAPAYW